MSRSRHSTPRQLSLRYLFALGLLGVLAVVNYGMFRAEIREGEASAAIQHVSDHYRMLFHRCVVLAEEFVRTNNQEQRDRLRERLLELVSELETVHYRLIQFDSPRQPLEESPRPTADDITESRVRQIYFDAPWLLDTEVRNYIAQIQALAESEPEELSPANPHLRYVRDVAITDHVTGALDEVVAAYDQQSDAKTAQLRRAAYGSLVGTCLVLVLMGLFVFRPMVRRVREEMQALENLNQTLEERVSERTALAEERARELEESEAALRSQTRILLQSERLAAIGQMVAGVAHESRNALQKIQACTQLLRWRLNGSADGEVDELISDVQQAQERLHRLFEDLRGFAAPLRLDRRRCDVSEVMHKAWETANSLSNGRIATLEQAKRIGDLHIMADPFQLEQVFRNLFENSLAAGPYRTAVDVEFDEVDDNGHPALSVRVRDNGPGLSPEAKAHLFEPFFTTKAEGTGLGTAIVRRIVTAHNGRVELEDGSRPGAAFRIILPKEEA